MLSEANIREVSKEEQDEFIQDCIDLLESK